MANKVTPITWSEKDIPQEWRIELKPPTGAILREFTKEESDAVEMDRR